MSDTYNFLLAYHLCFIITWSLIKTQNESYARAVRPLKVSKHFCLEISHFKQYTFFRKRRANENY